MKQDRAEHLKNQFSQLKIEVMPMFINLDFKDIDLMYTLYKRYLMTIQKEIDEMFNPSQKPPAPKAEPGQAKPSHVYEPADLRDDQLNK